MPLCANMISSWVRQVLGIAKAHMSPSTFHGAAVCAILAAGFFPDVYPAGK